MASRFLALKTAFAAIKGGHPEEAPFNAETFLTPRHQEISAATTAEITARYGELLAHLDERTHALFAKHLHAHMLTCGEAAAGHIEDMTKNLQGEPLAYMLVYQKLHLLEKFLATPLEPHWAQNYETVEGVYRKTAEITTENLLAGIRGRPGGGGPTPAQKIFLEEHGLSL